MKRPSMNAVFFFFLIFVSPAWAGTLPQLHDDARAEMATFSCDVAVALDATVRLKLQAELAENVKAKKLAEQAEKLLLKALGLVTNAENFLKPIPVP